MELTVHLVWRKNPGYSDQELRSHSIDALKETMSRKSIIMLGMIVGSCVGGYATTLFGSGMLSFTSLIGSTIGGILGIWIAFKIT
jgi:hypothetical protein